MSGTSLPLTVVTGEHPSCRFRLRERIPMDPKFDRGFCQVTQRLSDLHRLLGLAAIIVDPGSSVTSIVVGVVLLTFHVVLRVRVTSRWNRRQREENIE